MNTLRPTNPQNMKEVKDIVFFDLILKVEQDRMSIDAVKARFKGHRIMTTGSFIHTFKYPINHNVY